MHHIQLNVGLEVSCSSQTPLTDGDSLLDAHVPQTQARNHGHRRPAVWWENVEQAGEPVTL